MARIQQARSKQCLIVPAIAKLSADDLGAGHIGELPVLVFNVSPLFTPPYVSI